MNVSRQAYHYGVSEKLDSLSTDSWITNAWYPNSIFIYSYNTSGITDTILNLDYLGSALTNSSRNAYSFDANGNASGEITWFWLSGSWSVFSIDSMAYNAGGKETYWLERAVNYDSQLMENNSQIFFYYDANGNDTGELVQEWNDTTSSWNNTEQVTLTYDGSALVTSQISQDWQAGAWVNSSRDTYTYNTGKIFASVLFENWINGAWQNETQITHTYDANGNNTTTLTQSWDSTNVWVNSSLVTKTFLGNSPILAARGPAQGVGLSLAPTSDGFQISYSVSEPSRVELKIVDPQGRETMELANGFVPGSIQPYVTAWNGQTGSGNRMGAGSYFLVLRTQGISGSTRQETKVIYMVP